MGREGIRRRKPRIKRHKGEGLEDTGIIADLEDQAAYGSYGSGIPRGGGGRRNAIWWNRGFRFYRNLMHVDSNRTLRDRRLWLAILIGTGTVVGAALLLEFVLALVRSAT